MKHAKPKTFIWPPLDQWIMGLMVPMALVVSVLGSSVLFWFRRLTGIPWLWCYAVALTLAATGIGLLFYAKLPLYRQHRFFTFGSNAIPDARRSFYRWGYLFAVSSVALFGGLLLSKHS